MLMTSDQLIYLNVQSGSSFLNDGSSFLILSEFLNTSKSKEKLHLKSFTNGIGKLSKKKKKLQK